MANKKKRKEIKSTPAKNTLEATVGGKLLGLIGDFFAAAGIIELRLLESVAVGDMIRIQGTATDLTQRVGVLSGDDSRFERQRGIPP